MAIDSPVDIQNQIVERIVGLGNGGVVKGTQLADALEIELPILRVHLELLNASRRITTECGDDGYLVWATEEQRARHAAVPVNVATRQRLEHFGQALERIQARINRMLAWAPVVLSTVGAVVGWCGSRPEMRVETAFFAGVFGLLVGVMIRKELIR